MHGRGALQAAQAQAYSPDAPPWVGIFEDDLILTTSPPVASQRIRAALQQLPPGADALYLEWCWDTCSAARFHAARDVISVPYEPFCSAAIIYSRRGVDKLVPMLVPVYTTIDDMIRYHGLYAALSVRLFLCLSFPLSLSLSLSFMIGCNGVCCLPLPCLSSP